MCSIRVSDELRYKLRCSNLRSNFNTLNSGCGIIICFIHVVEIYVCMYLLLLVLSLLGRKRNIHSVLNCFRKHRGHILKFRQYHRYTYGSLTFYLQTLLDQDEIPYRATHKLTFSLFHSYTCVGGQILPKTYWFVKTQNVGSQFTFSFIIV